MEDSLQSMILHGCNLAKNLERNLPILANQPDTLVKSCEEIVSVFRNVRETVLSVGQMSVQELHGFEIGGGVREQARASLDAQAIAGVGSAYVRRVNDVPDSSEMKGMLLHDQPQRQQLCLESMFDEMGSGSGVGGDIMGGSTGGIGGETPPDFSSASSSQRQGRR